MIAFLEQRIDTKITQGAESGVRVVGRTKTYLPNGDLDQNFLSTRPIHFMEISHGVRSRADFQAVLDIFYIVMFTPYIGFRAKDWRDFLATAANSKLTLIAGSTWQLQRKHVFGGVIFLRDITKPVASTVVVYRTRTGAVTVATATVDYTTGIATITGHTAGDTYTWAGEFDVPVTFTDDEWTASFEVSTDNLYLTSGLIKLEEVRPVA